MDNSIFVNSYGTLRTELGRHKMGLPDHDDSVHLGRKGIMLFAKGIKSSLIKRVSPTGQPSMGIMLLPRIVTHQNIMMAPIRENCVHCGKNIYTHNPIIICNSCSKIIHHSCVSEALFKVADGRNYWLCHDCHENHGPIRYNPFEDYVVNSSTHFYDQEPVDSIECLQDISTILNNCSANSIDEFNTKINNTLKQGNVNNTPFTILFNNIDGNA